MNKIIVLLIAFCAISFNSLAQDSTRIDAVLLKNGSFIKGEIRMNKEATKLFIKTIGGSTLELGMDEVSSLQFDVKEESLLADFVQVKNKRSERARDVPKDGRFYNRAAFGMMFPFGNGEYRQGESLSYTLAYRFQKLVQLGIGFDLDFLQNDYGSNDSNLSIHLEYRCDFIDKSSSPFFGFKIGPYFSSFIADRYNDSSKTGLKFNPAMGIRFASKSRAHVELSAGYLLLTGLNDNSYYYYYNEGSKHSSNINATISVSF